MRRAFRRALLTAAGVLGLLAPALAQPSSRFTQQAPPPAFAPRTTGSPTTESRVEMAWMAHAEIASTPLKAVVSRGLLEVHGEVANEAARQMVLVVARENCTLPVTDHLKIKPFAVRQHGRDGVASLTAGAQEVLARTLGPVAGGLRVQVAESGQITLTGQVPALDHKLTASRHLRGLPGCTGVVNQLTVTAVVPTVAAPQPVAMNQMIVAPLSQPRTPIQTTSAMQLRPVTPPLMTPPPAADLLKPPAQPVTTTGRQAEEMHLLQLPTVPGYGTRSTSAKPKSPPTIARTSQFASLSPHAQPNGGRDPVPVATAPLGASSIPAASNGPLVSFEEEQSPRQGVATARAQTGNPVPQPNPVRTVAATTSVSTGLKARVERVCGTLAREVKVITGANQEITVQVQVANNAAEEQLTPRLLAMPELSSGKVRLEVHVPQ